MTRSNAIAFAVIGAAALTLVILFFTASVILERSGACTLTLLLDNQFGDQHMKSAVGLLELYKVRHGRYPDRIADLDFIGDWDRIPMNAVVYHPNESRTRYYLEVRRGWMCAPRLSYPDAFWNGTGYDPQLKPQ